MAEVHQTERNVDPHSHGILQLMDEGVVGMYIEFGNSARNVSSRCAALVIRGR